MEMLEERSWLVDCREETQEERADAMRTEELSARPTLRRNGSLSLRCYNAVFLHLTSLKGIGCGLAAPAAAPALSKSGVIRAPAKLQRQSKRFTNHKQNHILPNLPIATIKVQNDVFAREEIPCAYRYVFLTGPPRPWSTIAVIANDGVARPMAPFFAAGASTLCCPLLAV